MKIRILILSVLMVISACNLFALTYQVNNIVWTYTVYNGEAVLGGNGTKAVPTSTTGAITIPSTLGGYTITKIWIGAFSGCTGLTSVAIPGSVTNIMSLAFSGCTGLTSVTIPNSVTSIGSSAFYGCIGLTSVTIPNSVKIIENTAFMNCSGLSSVTIPSSVTSIEVGAFSGCTNLRSVTIPDSLRRIERVAFRNCSHLASITIPNSVTYIGTSSFTNCSCLASVTIPDSVTWIDCTAFCDCTNLMSVTINGKVDTDWSEGTQPFRGCTNLRTVDLGSRMAKVGAYMFYGQSSLESIAIPDSVTAFGENAFSGCDNIVTARVPQSAMALGLADIFPDSYRKLNHLTVGADVAAIRDDEFHNFQSLTEIVVDPGNTNFIVSADGCLYSADRTTLVVCSRNATAIAIPPTVTKIYNYAFEDCFALQTSYYKMLSGLVANGGGETPDPRYALSANVADRAIATVTVDGNSAIDAFVLTDGKVFDTVLRVINVSTSPSTLSLPSGYAYERLKGTAPLTIPALSTNLLTITRTADRVFFVAREELEAAQ